MSEELSKPLPRGEVVADGRYRIQSELGRGAFGITYKAIRVSDKKPYAIKEYMPQKTSIRMAGGSVRALKGKEREFEMGKEVFYQEALVLRGLPKQRGLVKVRGASKRKGTYLCMMEFVDGRTVQELVPKLLKRRSFVPEEIIHPIVFLVSEALHTLHTKAKFTHRDIKPANIMIRRSTGEPVLIDFGAARPIGRDVQIPDLYTKAYAAIEQFESSKSQTGNNSTIGPWTDIFALSVVLYEMMSQSLPLPAHRRWAELKANGSDPYIPIRDNLDRNRIQADYSDELLNLVDRGCQLLPQNRPQSAKEFARALGVPSGLRHAENVEKHAETRVITIWEETEENKIFQRLARVWEKGKLIWLILILAGAVGLISYLSGTGFFE